MLHWFWNCSILFFSLLVGIFSIFRAGMILEMDEVRFPPSGRIGRSSCMTNGSVGYGGGFRHSGRKLQNNLVCSNICSFMVDKSLFGKII